LENFKKLIRIIETLEEEFKSSFLNADKLKNGKKIIETFFEKNNAPRYNK